MDNLWPLIVELLMTFLEQKNGASAYLHQRVFVFTFARDSFVRLHRERFLIRRFFVSCLSALCFVPFNVPTLYLWVADESFIEQCWALTVSGTKEQCRVRFASSTYLHQSCNESVCCGGRGCETWGARRCAKNSWTVILPPFVFYRHIFEKFSFDSFYFSLTIHPLLMVVSGLMWFFILPNEIGYMGIKKSRP